MKKRSLPLVLRGLTLASAVLLSGCSADDAAPSDPPAGEGGAAPTPGAGGAEAVEPGSAAGEGGKPATSDGGAPSEVGPAAAGAGGAEMVEEAEFDAPEGQLELLPFLQERRYAAWASEPSLHASNGPHGARVRVFYSPKAARALTDSAATFPRGAAVIKEQPAGTASAWSVWIKVQDDSDLGRGFYWYEVLVGATSNSVAGDARGVAGCTGCHAAGKDYLLSEGTFE